MPTRVNLGPLTTVFNPAAACSTAFAENFRGTSYASEWGIICSTRPSSGFDILGRSSCYPAAQESLTDVEGNVAFFSPGLQCPSGFTSACTISRNNGDSAPTAVAQANIWNNLEPGETAVGCCLSGLNCAYDDHFQCYGYPTIGHVYSGFSFDSNCAATPTTISVTSVPPTNSPYAVGSRVNLIINSNSAGGTSETSASTANHSSGDMSSLSTGAKIGIGVAVPIFVLGVIGGLCLFFLLRRHKKAKALQDKVPQNQAWVSPSGGQEGYTRQDHQHPPPMSELQSPRNGASDVSELGSPDLPELGSQDPHEFLSLQAGHLAPQQSSITYENEMTQGYPLNSNSLHQPQSMGPVQMMQYNGSSVSSQAIPTYQVVGSMPQPSSTMQIAPSQPVGNSLADDVPGLINRLQPGFYGHFPESFDLYRVGTTFNDNADLYHLGRPLIASMAHFKSSKKGRVNTRKHQMTLYSGDFNTQPLAFAGIPKKLSHSSIIGIPGELITVKNSTSAWKLNTSYKFENYEWRNPDMRRKPMVQELVRDGHIVATWTEDISRNTQERVGRMQFHQQLHERDALLAVIMLLRICQLDWTAMEAAEKLMNTGAQLLTTGVMLSF